MNPMSFHFVKRTLQPDEPKILGIGGTFDAAFENIRVCCHAKNSWCVLSVVGGCAQGRA